MPEQFEWWMWWGIAIGVLILIGVIGTLLIVQYDRREKEERGERRRMAEKFTPTHRRTREKG